jgi:hypothetical protein
VALDGGSDTGSRQSGVPELKRGTLRRDTAQLEIPLPRFARQSVSWELNPGAEARHGVSLEFT